MTVSDYLFVCRFASADHRQQAGYIIKGLKVSHSFSTTSKVAAVARTTANTRHNFIRIARYLQNSSCKCSTHAPPYIAPTRSSTRPASCNEVARRLIHMATFDVSSFVAQWQGKAASVDISKPRQVSCWTKTSQNEGSEFLFGSTTGLLSYTSPALPADLNQGFEDNYTKKDDSQPSPVDTIIQAATDAAVEWSSVTLCTYRNNLNKILLTPLGGDQDWSIDCLFWGNTLFLDINKSGNVEYPNQDKFTYYGYKFEALCTGQDHVDSSSEFAVLVQYRLGSHHILMAAEIDAAKDQGDGPIGGQPYVELKTYRIPAHAKAVSAMYKEKHPRWWVQSFLAGVDTLVLGGRDHAGTLKKVHEVPVHLLPGLSANAGQGWDPNMLLAFGDAVLAWIAAAAQQRPGQQMLATYSHKEKLIRIEQEEGDMADRLQQLLPVE